MHNVFQCEISKRFNNFSVLLIGVSLVLAGCGGGKDICTSRSEAEKIVKEVLQKETGNPDGLRYIDETKNRDNWRYITKWYEKPAMHDYFTIQREIYGGKYEGEKYKKLEQQGFVIIGKVIDSHNDPSIEIKFTEKAKPYIVSTSKRFWKSTDHVDISLAEIDTVKVTGITHSEGLEKKMCKVKFKAYYKPTPFGELFLEPKHLTREGVMPFILYDDGWRVERPFK